MKKILLAILVLAISLVGFACTTASEDSNSTNSSVTTPDNPALLNAMAQVSVKYGAMAEKTGSSFELDQSAVGNDVKFDIAWTLEGENLGEVVKIVEETDKDDNKILTLKIDVLAAKSDIPYTLKATMTAENGDTLTQEFKHIVPQLRKSTHEQYMNAKKGELLWLEGTVIAMNSKENGNKKNHVYFADADGAYYAYSGSKDPVADYNLAVGMKVKVIGTKDIYNGTHEVKNYTVEVLSNEVAPVAPRDLTELVTNAESLINNDELLAHQSEFVVIKNVLVHTVDDGNMTFKVGNNKSYYRISGSSSFLTEAEETKLQADHAANFGKIADVQGIVTFFDGKFYLAPVSGEFFANATLPERTAEEKVALEQEAIVIPTDITEYTIIDVPATGKLYKDVAISWTSDNKDLVSFEKGQMTIKLGGVETEVKVTATFEIAASQTRATKEFTLKLAADKVYDVNYLTAAPEVNKKYKLALDQVIRDETLLFSGDKSGYFLATTDLVEASADVMVEAVEGKEGEFVISFMDGAAKKYLKVYEREAASGDKKGKGGVELVDAVPAETLTYDAELNTLVHVSATSKYYLGTRGTFNTFSCENAAYLTAENTNTQNFIARFATISLNNSTPAEKVDFEKGKIVMPTEEVAGDTTLNLPSQGKKFKDVLITWTVNGVDTTDNYEIVLGDKAQTLTVVATLKCGADVVETVTYTINVAVATKTEKPVANKNYNMVLMIDGAARYLTATVNSGKCIETSVDKADAAVFTLVDAVNAGEYYMKVTLADGTVKYLNTTGTKSGCYVLGDVGKQVYKISNSFDSVTFKLTDGKEKIIATQSGMTVAKAYASSNTTKEGYTFAQFIAVK